MLTQVDRCVRFHWRAGMLAVLQWKAYSLHTFAAVASVVPYFFLLKKQKEPAMIIVAGSLHLFSRKGWSNCTPTRPLVRTVEWKAASLAGIRSACLPADSSTSHFPFCPRQHRFLPCVWLIHLGTETIASCFDLFNRHSPSLLLSGRLELKHHLLSTPTPLWNHRSNVPHR